MTIDGPKAHSTKYLGHGAARSARCARDSAGSGELPALHGKRSRTGPDARSPGRVGSRRAEARRKAPCGGQRGTVSGRSVPAAPKPGRTRARGRDACANQQPSATRRTPLPRWLHEPAKKIVARTQQHRKRGLDAAAHSRHPAIGRFVPPPSPHSRPASCPGRGLLEPRTRSSSLPEHRSPKPHDVRKSEAERVQLRGQLSAKPEQNHDGTLDEKPAVGVDDVLHERT